MNSTGMAGSFNRTGPSASASVWFATSGFIAILGFLLLPYIGLGGDGQNFYYMGISAATTWAVIAGAQRVRRSRRLPWLVLAAGQFSYTLGDVAYYVAHAIFDSDAFPSVADLFYLLQYPLVGAALVLLVRRRTPSWDMATLLDAAILALGLGLLWWVYLIGPLATDYDASESLASILVSIAYPVMDLIVLATAIRLAVGAGSRSTAFRLLMASLLAMLAADMLYGLQTANDTYQDGGAPDVLWLTEYVLLGAAALHPSMRTLDQRAKVALPNVTGGRVLLLTFAALLPMVLLYARYITQENAGAPIVLLCGVSLFALVITRMWMVLGIQQRLAIVDDLTGLNARGVLLSHLDLEVERGHRYRQEVGFLLIDVDQFKLIEQIHGQPGGHEVLAELAQRLVRLSGNAAILGRMGANMFGAVLPGYSGGNLRGAAIRVREVIETEKFAVGDQEEVRVTVSIGLAGLHEDGVSSGDLLDHAEKALRRAKTAGRNRVYASTGPVEPRW
ncbi:GGDEF domain-containing protein [Actinoplanes subglobosus]|uniref:Diguanylate cyclase n=1 Tax=Actinoplanes subglobosus TaxID=1547892 RepID=A0ABV8J0H2_9ACTN